ncbi:MAG: hypothetical protein R6V85_20815 [Polyangia bacterium]
MSRDDDRRERDWREIDRRKDRSRHRQPDRRSMDPRRRARSESASKVYRSQLDSFFDGDGRAPAHVGDKLAELDDVSPEGKRRKAALDAIREAKTSFAAAKAVNSFLKKWELPPDHDVLAAVLASADEDHQRAALDQVSELLQRGRPPKRKAVLEQRLRRIADLGDEPDLIDDAKELLRRLRDFP